MKIIVHSDTKELELIYDSQIELDTVRRVYAQKIRNWRFRIPKGSKWDGTVNFLRNYKYLPIGLWKHLITLCSEYGFPVGIKNKEYLVDDSVTLEQVVEFCQEHYNNADFEIDSDQMTAIYLAVKYKFFSMDLSQRFGKTLLFYLISKYLIHKTPVKKVLIITINPGLVGQMYADFEDYAGGVVEDVTMLLSKNKLKSSTGSIHITNFQYLVNVVKTNPEFFEQYEAVLVDECHRLNETIKSVITACKNRLYTGGFSGSIVKDNTADYLGIIAYYGEILKTVTKKELMTQGRATPISIRCITVNSVPDSVKKELYYAKSQMPGEQVLRLELQAIRDSPARLKFIASLCKKINGNILIFFVSTMDGYGRRLVEELKLYTQDRTIMYVDQHVPDSLRSEFKARMEQSNNNILVSTYETLSTGHTIRNLPYIICAEPIKAETTLSQAIGRGMTTHHSKDKFTWIDIIDDLQCTFQDHITGTPVTYENYASKWGKIRKSYYKKEGFSYKEDRINLINSK